MRGRRRRAAAAVRPAPGASSARRGQPSRAQAGLVDLHARQLGQLARDAHEARHPLRPEVGLRLRGTRRTSARSNASRSSTSTATITRSPTGSSGTAYTAAERTPGCAQHDAPRPARRRSSRRRPAATRSSGRRRRTSRRRRGRRGRPTSTCRRAPSSRWPPRCGSSPRTPSPGSVLTISPTASSAFASRPSASNSARGHSSPVSGSSTVMVSSAVPERAGRHRRVAADDDEALGRAVAVAHRRSRSARANSRMSASDASLPNASVERDVGVVGRRRHREDVVEDLAGVRQHRGAHAADVGHRAATPRTAPGSRTAPPALQRARQSGEQRARVEERQRRVHGLARTELGDASSTCTPVRAKPALGAAHRLREAGRARREDQQVEVVGLGRRVPGRSASTAASCSRVRRALSVRSTRSAGTRLGASASRSA